MIRIASTKSDFIQINKLRKEVYCEELGQYSTTIEKLPGNNNGWYIISEISTESTGVTEIDGFIYISFGYPYEFNRHTSFLPEKRSFELGRLTVKKSSRYNGIASRLFNSAIIFCKTRNWSEYFYCIANEKLVEKYIEHGMFLVPDENEIICGGITYFLMRGIFSSIPTTIDTNSQLNIPAVHGGNFLDNVDILPTSIETPKECVIADVLDSWYEPSFSPTITTFVIRSSPSSNCNQLVKKIRHVRNIPNECEIVCGSGSSDLIYRALPNLLTVNSKVLILKPTYSEYPHIFKNVIGCVTDELNVGYDELSVKTVTDYLENNIINYDMVCFVNPNSPTGYHIDMISIIEKYKNVDFFIDETYVDLVGIKNKLENISLPNLFVLKSMSKSYALSGVRVAYLVGPKNEKMNKIKMLTPPWSVNYYGQLYGIKALEDEDYYVKMWELTRKYNTFMKDAITKKGIKVVSGQGNFIVIECDNSHELCEKMKKSNIFIRVLDDKNVRIAIRSEKENMKILEHL